MSADTCERYEIRYVGKAVLGKCYTNKTAINDNGIKER